MVSNLDLGIVVHENFCVHLSMLNCDFALLVMHFIYELCDKTMIQSNKESNTRKQHVGQVSLFHAWIQY